MWFDRSCILSARASSVLAFHVSLFERFIHLDASEQEFFALSLVSP